MRSKLTTILAAVVLTLGLYSCTSSEDGFAGDEKASGFVTAYKTSEIVAYVGTDTLVSDLTRALPDGLTDKAYFYLRIDDRVLTAEGVVYNPTLYYPRTSGNGSLKSSVNEGKINLSYDFYAGLGTVPHYIYDPQGEEVLKAIGGEIPTVEALLNGDQGKPKVTLPSNSETLKVIWYVAKYQTIDRVWHVDGVLTDQSTPSIDDIPDFKKEDGLDPVSQGMVEINLAIQEHKDEQSSKLSIHVRDTTDVTVTIPMKPEYFLKADDVTIVQKHYDNMTYGKSMKIGNTTVEITVEYSDAGITVSTKGINSEVLKVCRELFEDGLTFEVWNYFNENTTADIMKEALDKSTVTFTRTPKTYFNAILGPLDVNVKPVSGYQNVETIDKKGKKYTK